MSEEEIIDMLEECAWWDMILYDSERIITIQETYSDDVGFDWSIYDYDGVLRDGGVLVDAEVDWDHAVPEMTYLAAELPPSAFSVIERSRSTHNIQ